jgi:ADP-dependent phosphofructokinase/glucokinase
MSSVDATTETPADIRPSTAIRDPLADHLISPQNSAQEITNWYFTEVLKVTDSVGIAEAEAARAQAAE